MLLYALSPFNVLIMLGIRFCQFSHNRNNLNDTHHNIIKTYEAYAPLKLYRHLARL